MKPSVTRARLLPCTALLAALCTACAATVAETVPSTTTQSPGTVPASQSPDATTSESPGTTVPTSRKRDPKVPPAGRLPPEPAALIDRESVAGDCNTTSWTWPFCDIPWPSVPRFKVSGGRPDLTPKNSPWCTSRYIKGGGNSGYTYWLLTQNTKYKLRFWPDYYSRYYEAIYWDGRAWQWLPVSRDYPHIIMGQRVNCDA